MTKIFISNFAPHTTIARIADLFLGYGDVVAVRLKQGEKRVYAIVEMPNDSEADEAIRELDGRNWDGERLQVMESNC